MASLILAAAGKLGNSESGLQMFGVRFQGPVRLKPMMLGLASEPVNQGICQMATLGFLHKLKRSPADPERAFDREP